MPYQYGMQNSPAGGNGLGGLPKKQTTPQGSTYTRVVINITTPRVALPPANAKYMRVAVIGAGGLCASLFTSAVGGGGGGCAASRIVRASPVQYLAVNQGGAGTGANTVATFPGYQLVGQGGIVGSLGGGQGGQGSGGDYNFRGGNGTNFTSAMYLGGGGAGPNGDGGDGGLQGTFDGSGWGCGGGSGGIGRVATSTDGAVTGGGGAGSLAGTPTSTPTIATLTMTGFPDYINYPFGASSAPSRASGTAGSGMVSQGGEGGGGGSGAEINNVFTRGGGGDGLIIIEWFYD